MPNKKKPTVPPIQPSKPVVKKPRKKYVARNVIDYISVVDGLDKHVEHGDVFDDMNSVGIRNELDYGNIEEYEEGGEQ
jgi:hypothetical protein